MANYESNVVIDSNMLSLGSETVILLHEGQSLTPEQISSLLSRIPTGNAKQVSNTVPCPTVVDCNNLLGQSATANLSTNLTPDPSPSITTKNQTRIKAGAKSKKKTPPKPTQVRCNINQVLSSIDPNLLTPNASPVFAENPISNITPIRVKMYPSINSSPATVLPADSLVDLPSTPLSSVAAKKSNVIPNIKLEGTLVFFDLETTGLGYIIGASNVHITEISLVAFDRKEFWQSKNSDLKDVRIIQKLSMCVRPRTAISSTAAKITGLDNDNLVDQGPFDRHVATAITSFLSHLPKPVCLLAHNGNVFDFPLLKAEFKRLSVDLPSDLQIADTLSAFKSIGIAESPPDRKICKSVKYGRSGRLSHSLENLHLFFFNKKPTGSHSSEGDCIALAKVCHKLKDEAIPWIEANAKTFENIKAMW